MSLFLQICVRFSHLNTFVELQYVWHVRTHENNLYTDLGTAGMNQYLQNVSHTPIALDWCDLGSPTLHILATMQQQLNSLEVKFDKILKSEKKGAGDLDVSKRSSSSFLRSPTPGPLSPTFPTQRTTSDNFFEGEAGIVYSYFFSVVDSPALCRQGGRHWYLF